MTFSDFIKFISCGLCGQCCECMNDYSEEITLAPFENRVGYSSAYSEVALDSDSDYSNNGNWSPISNFSITDDEENESNSTGDDNDKMSNEDSDNISNEDSDLEAWEILDALLDNCPKKD
tara:strand:- start:405 stop:764 length:360 start_codon:yes stop_codon:yes gene_type:complete